MVTDFMKKDAEESKIAEAAQQESGEVPSVSEAGSTTTAPDTATQLSSVQEEVKEENKGES